MSRKYKQTTKRIRKTPKEIHHAVQLALDGNISSRAAATDLGFPRSALQRHVQAAKKLAAENYKKSDAVAILKRKAGTQQINKQQKSNNSLQQPWQQQTSAQKPLSFRFAKSPGQLKQRHQPNQRPFEVDSSQTQAAHTVASAFLMTPELAEKYFAEQIIRKSNKKKKMDTSGKTKYQIVIDYRKLNEATIDKLDKSEYLTTLDLASGFHPVEMEKGDIEKTTFSTEQGHYEFKQIPFRNPQRSNDSWITFLGTPRERLHGDDTEDLIKEIDDLLTFHHSTSQELPNITFTQEEEQLNTFNSNVNTESRNSIPILDETIDNKTTQYIIDTIHTGPPKITLRIKKHQKISTCKLPTILQKKEDDKTNEARKLMSEYKRTRVESECKDGLEELKKNATQTKQYRQRNDTIALDRKWETIAKQAAGTSKTKMRILPGQTKSIATQTIEDTNEDAVEKGKERIKTVLASNEENFDLLASIIDMEWPEGLYKATKIEKRNMVETSTEKNLVVILDPDIGPEDKRLKWVLMKCPEITEIIKEGLREEQIEYARSSIKTTFSKSEGREMDDVPKLFELIKQLKKETTEHGTERLVITAVVEKTGATATKSKGLGSEKVIVKAGRRSYADPDQCNHKKRHLQKLQYISPNSGTEKFEACLNKLEDTTRETYGPILVTGDFNAHTVVWGDHKEDQRGRILLERVETYNLTVCNEGYGSFGVYLNAIKKKESKECALCRHSPDDVEHVLHECDKWHRERSQVQTEIAEQLTPENTIAQMLESQNK
ncbi:hypothetical protein ILUMI_00063 [Ignelater luminosus]|uniref:Endonuclease/exonuclease/phosphatase domain-containing protein n=1 Tax=Ignelater luminosus TaxID=2038154 RepID=A0A8K0DMK0_IGNLU|nr:hypothetical protein ILUMI_00063 [Ignelater luminosus]